MSGLPLAVGVLVVALMEYALNRLMLLFFVPTFLVLILVSGLGSKNFQREVPNMGHFRSFLFLIVCALAIFFPFLAKYSDDMYGFFQFLLTFSVSAVALIVAIVEVTVLGQRISLRANLHLDDSFFKKQKTLWEKDLEGFPNSERIIEKIDDGKFIPVLFDRGSFNLVVLWTCNLMEEIIDASVDGIIQKDPTKKLTFKNEKGGPLRYPSQLKNLNYVHRQAVGRESEQMSVEDLWDKVRNSIAHHNHRPTFDQTFATLTIFVQFMGEFPKTLQSWK